MFQIKAPGTKLETRSSFGRHFGPSMPSPQTTAVNEFPSTGVHPKVECPPSVLEEIRQLAVKGFTQLGRGGLEVGGVLYGTRDGERVVVSSFAELACEHALGPAFVLSEKDRQGLPPLLSGANGLEAVGWFRVHSHNGLALDFHDRLFYQCFPRDVPSAALILKPTTWGPAVAAFFVREPDGQIVPPSPHEFLLAPPKAATRPFAAHADVPPNQSRPAAAVPPEAPARRPRWELWALAPGIAACCFAAWTLWPRPAPNLDLVATVIAPGEVHIQWNHHAPAILRARSGTLLIDDGDRSKAIPLERDQLQSSSVTYSHESSRIFVRLHVVGSDPGAPPVDEAIQYIGQPQPATAAAATAATSTRAIEPPPPATRSEVRVPIAVAPQAKVELISPHQPLANPFRAPAIAPLTAASVAALPSPPALSSGSRQAPVPDMLSSAAPPPAPRPSAGTPPAPAVYAGPRAGRIIWTGDLKKGGLIEIGGNRSGIGSLSGGLPGVPIAIRVSPAELDRSGLTVFTADPARAADREAPGRANGWNALHFQVDPERARGVAVVESPNSANDFKRLVLRNDLRNCSVVVIDWTVQ